MPYQRKACPCRSTAAAPSRPPSPATLPHPSRPTAYLWQANSQSPPLAQGLQDLRPNPLNPHNSQHGPPTTVNTRIPPLPPTRIPLIKPPHRCAQGQPAPIRPPLKPLPKESTHARQDCPSHTPSPPEQARTHILPERGPRPAPARKRSKTSPHHTRTPPQGGPKGPCGQQTPFPRANAQAHPLLPSHFRPRECRKAKSVPPCPPPTGRQPKASPGQARTPPPTPQRDQRPLRPTGPVSKGERANQPAPSPHTPDQGKAHIRKGSSPTPGPP